MSIGVSISCDRRKWKGLNVYLSLVNEASVNKDSDEDQRLRRLVDHNAIHSAQNVCYSTIVQDAWKRGQKLTVHAWVHDIADG